MAALLCVESPPRFAGTGLLCVVSGVLRLDLVTADVELDDDEVGVSYTVSVYLLRGVPSTQLVIDRVVDLVESLLVAATLRANAFVGVCKGSGRFGN